MSELSRRQIIGTSCRLVAGAGAIGLVASGLAGCESAPRRKVGNLGEPIASDPRVLDAGVPRRPGTPGTVYTPRTVPATPAPRQFSYVIPRDQWSRYGPNYADTKPMNGIRRITVHHDGMRPASISSASGWASRLESIRRSHVGANGWADIGYHFAIDPEGRVWEGRPIALQGAHVRDQNENNVGVLVLGNFETERPSGYAVTTLERLLTDLIQTNRVSGRSVHTHRELAQTLCPGRFLQPQLERVRSTRLAML